MYTEFEEIFKNFGLDDLYDALSDSTDSYIYMANLNTNKAVFSKSFSRDFDFPSGIVTDPDSYLLPIVHPDDRQKYMDANIRTFSGETDYHLVEYRVKNRKGEWIWVSCRGKVTRKPDGAVLFTGFINNMGAISKIDPQTGMYNKYEFERYFENTTARSNSNIAIMLLGIDDFKLINEVHGRAFGDGILRFAANKLKEILPSFIEVFRLDGDCFALVASNRQLPSGEDVFSSIQASFSGKQMYEGKHFFITLSAGSAIYPQDGITFRELYLNAERALVNAKITGKNKYVRYSRDILYENKRSAELKAELHEAVTNNFKGFSLLYQPQFISATKQFKGAEALLRWNSEKYGGLSPMIFIPILEETGLITEVGEWVIKEAAKTCGKWKKIFPDVTMSVNISYVQMVDKSGRIKNDLINAVVSAIKENGIEPHNLILELTESCIAEHIDTLRASLIHLKEMGVSVSMDDFGTGYSSLFLLKNAPVNEVKIDRAFICEDDDFNIAFISTIHSLCKQLGMKVCQEGVETEEQYGLVHDLGIDIIQGFYFDKPISKPELEKRYLNPPPPRKFPFTGKPYPLWGITQEQINESKNISRDHNVSLL